MSTIKIISVLLALFLGIVSLIFTVGESSKKALYDAVLESMMNRFEVSSVEELEEYFPEVKEIRSSMDSIVFLNHEIHRLTGGPSPNLSMEQCHQLQSLTKEIQYLRKNVSDKLKGLMVHSVSEGIEYSLLLNH